MIKEYSTYIWGLCIYQKRKNRYGKRWRVGERGEWKFKSKNEALKSIPHNTTEVTALMFNPITQNLTEKCQIKVHKSLPKYVSSADHLQSPKPHQVHEDTPLPFPGWVVCADENGGLISRMATCFVFENGAYREL